MKIERCAKCGMPATIFVTQTVNGNTTQQFLCDECYRQEHYNFYLKKQPKVPKQEVVCPSCKTTQKQFLDTGFLGCPNCYKAFSKTIDDLLPKIQGGKTHIPRKHIGVVEESAEEKLKSLQLQLLRATKAMKYDEADKIYQQITELDKK